MSGWIKLHRAISQSSIADNPELLALWIHMLVSASHTARRQPVGNQLVELLPGQFVYGRDKFSLKTGLSIAKLRASVLLLEKMNQITIKTTNKFSIISITNWSLYQLDNQQTASTQPTDNQQTTTDKNVNNLNNVKNSMPESSTPAPVDSPLNCPHQAIIQIYHDKLPELPRVLDTTWKGSSREKDLQARLRHDKRHQTLDFWEAFFDGVARSKFHLGENERSWRADLGWLVKRANFDKMVERIQAGQI